MDPLTVLEILAVIYIVIYAVVQAIGVEKFSSRGIEAGAPFFIMIKTKRLNALLTRLGKKFPRAFFNLGVVIAFGGMAFGFWMFGENLLRFFIQPETAGGVVPVIPGVTITGLPLVYMLIGLAVALVTHEFAHGLASARESIPIKSSGLMFLFVLFGAFVEPDEEVMEKQSSPQSRMRLLAAGAYSNLIFAFIVFLLMANFNSLMSIGFNPPSGAYIYDTVPGSPGAQSLQVGDVIIGLNQTAIKQWSDVSVFLYNVPAGSLVIIQTLRGNASIHLAANPSNASKGYIGVYGADYWEPKPGWTWIPFGPMFVFHSEEILLWSFIILFSVALFNLLPIPALDGDKLLSNALSLKIKNKRTLMGIMWPMRIAAVSMIVLSMVLSLWFGKGLF
jgi:membrane-associated protease RseP (regulator of RpoE activity)